MDMDEILANFIKVCRLTGVTISCTDIEKVEGHESNRLPEGKMAVYIFMKKDSDNECYKVGRVGINSNARYQSHHYNPNSSKSNLARSIINDCNYINEDAVKQWIKDNTTRINLLLTRDKGLRVLNLLEAFIQVKLNPKYEGYKSQN